MNVLREVTKLSKFIDKLPEFEKEIFEQYPNYLIPGFNWTKAFSHRQAIDGLSIAKRKPLKFDKAVKTILLCHLAAKALKEEGFINAEPSDVYKNMRIEPAVFYLRDFDIRALNALLDKEAYLISDLTDASGQTHKMVFEDMARGYTVTRKLAENLMTFMSKHKIDIPVGPIQFKYRDGNRRVSDRETLSDG